MKLVKKLFFILTNILIVLLAILPTISFSQQLIISCNPCYVNNCQCTTSCNSGKMYVYKTESCQDTASYIITISNQKANFLSIQPGFFYAHVDCTETGEISSCQPLYVASYSGQTITTTATMTVTTTSHTTTQTQSITQTTSSMQSTQTTRVTTQTTRTTQIKNQQSSSFNTLLIVTVVIAAIVIVAVLLIYLQSKPSPEERYESLKRKWGR